VAIFVPQIPHEGINPVTRRWLIVGIAGLLFFWPLLSCLWAASIQLPSGFFSPTDKLDTTSYAGWLAKWPSYKPKGYYHLGQDIKTPLGANAYAIADGTVVRISRNGWGPNNVAVIGRHKLEDGSEFLAIYGHIRTHLKEGNRLYAGKPLGTIGPWDEQRYHLHFGIHPGLDIPSTGLGFIPEPIKPPHNGFTDPIKWITSKHPFGWKPIPIPTDLKSGAVDLAIVFDCSNSMVDPPDKMERAKQATYSIIDATRSHDQISLVSFAYRSWILASLTSPGNPGARSTLKAKTVAITAEDYTDIDAGLEEAFGLLSQSGSDRFKAVLLLTDGGHNAQNQSPFFWPIVAKYAQARIPIYTVAYGADADRRILAEIAKRTGGVAYLAGSSNLTQVYHWIAAMSKKASVLTSYQGRINQGDQHVYPVLIPDDIRRAWFGTDWEGSRVETTLVPPSGAEITSKTSNPQIRYAQGDSYCLYIVDQPEAGNWQVKLHGAKIPRTEQVNLTISGESPLWANSLLATPYWNQRNRVPITTHVAEVGKSSLKPVANAQVTATIRKPKITPARLIGVDRRGKIRINIGATLEMVLDKPQEIQLYDNGSHGDQTAHDGIYTGTYSDTDRDGPYEVEIRCQARLSNGKLINRTLHESFHVGDPRTNKASLLDLLAVIAASQD